MHLGKNILKNGDGATVGIEVKKIPTWRSGNCDMIQFYDVENWDVTFAELYIGYSKNLDHQNIPKEFTIHLTSKDQWTGIVTETGLYQKQFKVNTKYNFPLYLEVYPLYREFYFPLPSNTAEKNEDMKSTLEYCFKSDKIRMILESKNCTEICIPIHYSSLYNTSEIKICSAFQNHFCAFYPIQWHIEEQQNTCMQPIVEKYFKGTATYKEDFSNYYPKIIKGDRKNRTLMVFYYGYKSNVTIISEEKLVYGSKDLLAWLGGALGIFVGYSFFDLAKTIIDVAFFFIYKGIGHHLGLN